MSDPSKTALAAAHKIAPLDLAAFERGEITAPVQALQDALRAMTTNAKQESQGGRLYAVRWLGEVYKRFGS